MPEKVVTRFAPSPTGYLHIGGARTALFNWLYARHTGGVMHLRIEDTDRERSTDAAVAAIFDGLSWLGLDWDGEPVMQFARATRHRAVAESLVAGGGAYRCYASAAELEEMRERARAEGRQPRYDGRWRDRSPTEAPAGVPSTVRIKAPTAGDTVIEDRVQGRVVFPNKDLDDFVILRSDGTPTYMLSVVVDDHDMGVTDIIRGDDHLTNAARQKIIYDALGWRLPSMAHIPLIHGSDGAKLSKRHGALGVDAYRALGYLPVALRNYLVRLGWSHGDAEIMSTEEMVSWFSVEAIGRSPARFDFAKLDSINAHYMRAMSDDELLAAFVAGLPHIKGGPEAAVHVAGPRLGRLRIALPALKERAKTLVDLWERASFLFADRPIALEPAAAALLTPDARGYLASAAEALSRLTEWSHTTTEGAVRALAEAKGIKLGALAQPLRAALTGKAASPGIFEVLLALGQEESIGRIQDGARS